MTRSVYVVPHCHWDREWYQPHELFRWRLVQMIDELLDYMEQHPEYRCFNLDGQTIVIEDYLELRPEHEGRLRALLQSGRIVIGPWLVQPDEFLPSGESHIRSFQRGIRFADRLGGCLRVGHCADQFGHIAQMPQIMAGLGLTSACLWRGVPGSIPGWSFWWEAPDGTRLPALYLRNSYSSGWRLPEAPADLIERVQRQERGRREGEPALLMNGTDHSRMEKHVPAALAAAAGRGYEFRLATLAEYEQAQLAAGIDEVVHHGELRSPDRSNVLVGVLSARMNIKQRDFQVSSLLERVAEPLELLSWLHHGPDGAPALRHAWRLLLENSPHDSICGCSVDQTHREMLPRYDRAEQLIRQVARESMAHLHRRLTVPDGGAVLAFRTVPGAAAVLECDVPGEWDATHLRLPGGETVPVALGPVQPGEVLQHDEVSPRGALRHLDFLREGRYDVHAIERQSWQVADGHLKVETRVGDGLAVLDEDGFRHEVKEAAEALAATAEVTVRRSATRRMVAVLPAANTVGVEVLAPACSPDRNPYPSGAVEAAGRRIANEFYEVSMKKGRLVVTDWQNGVTLENVSMFVDEGDRGDEYNADILPDAVLSGPPEDVICTSDAVSAEMFVVLHMRVPGELSKSRRRRKGGPWLLPILMSVRLWSGVPRVDFSVKLVNPARDHRLRALFPLPFATDTAWTENQFHVAERPLEPAPWNGESAEQPPTTFPQKTFAAMEGDGLGVAVFNRGLPEGEVVRSPDGRQAYALTLLRCVGWLSRNDLVSRRGGAGPMVTTPEAQMPGAHTFEYALTTYRGAWRGAGVQAMAHSFAHPPLAWHAGANSGGAGAALPLAVFPGEGVVPSAMHRSEADGRPVLRVYSSSPERLEAGLLVPAAGADAERTNLIEDRAVPLEASADGWRVPLRPWEIATVCFGRRE
jgi:hypothetical protein